MIQQPARCPDDHIHAAAEGVFLRAHAHAAEHGPGAERRVDGDARQVLEDLRGKFARRREHEGARRAARFRDEPGEDRQQERRGLAAARHRAGQQVAALERRRNRVDLDGGRLHETEVFDALEEVGMELEVAERHGILCRAQNTIMLH
jgi:hypothetical protein